MRNRLADDILKRCAIVPPFVGLCNKCSGIVSKCRSSPSSQEVITVPKLKVLVGLSSVHHPHMELLTNPRHLHDDADANTFRVHLKGAIPSCPKLSNLLMLPVLGMVCSRYRATCQRRQREQCLIWLFRASSQKKHYHNYRRVAQCLRQAVGEVHHCSLQLSNQSASRAGAVRA